MPVSKRRKKTGRRPRTHHEQDEGVALGDRDQLRGLLRDILLSTPGAVSLTMTLDDGDELRFEVMPDTYLDEINAEDLDDDEDDPEP